jgi:hypothetical protein
MPGQRGKSGAAENRLDEGSAVYSHSPSDLCLFFKESTVFGLRIKMPPDASKKMPGDEPEAELSVE